MRKHARSIQAPAAVVMVRPHHFTVNTETVADNRFQSHADTGEDLAAIARDEITRAAATLESLGVTVHLFEDEGRETPDSVFPNNWFSTHAGGHVAVYPMKAESRRRERRNDVLEMLKQRYRVQDVIDYSGLEPDGLFLEGTGAMVLDHIDRIAYAARSDRTDPIALERFATHFNFEPMVFDARDESGAPIYHTNVLMCVATDFALIGLDMIADAGRRAEIVARLERSGRDVVALTNDQIRAFAGNALELQGRDGRILALSQTAHAALTPEQIAVIEESALPMPLDIPTIEKAGGSVRCTLAGIHLAPR
ncbi:citrulline utilization hydrolase CtlX [Pinisolibacter aquiterrae]|uniref:citrulline utilization hydrolase CtlX n=1 Tax=Pinisolibacter aquiterrae TaxID=2815579 RepID=UPI001C3DD8AB|nr:arginine deiminase-related protein [Pinisolibacter aquiterrae]MBV5265922.1 amidinotransferase [Pinisolibacter aquiterrae]MCC8237220.1 arginine deiminase-related protein [Pinisolibacter aquiterrae]